MPGPRNGGHRADRACSIRRARNARSWSSVTAPKCAFTAPYTTAQSMKNGAWSPSLTRAAADRLSAAHVPLNRDLVHSGHGDVVVDDVVGAWVKRAAEIGVPNIVAPEL